MVRTNEDPLLSVIIAVHNGEPFLAAAITSILEQTFEDFEFIIIDDGSTDRSGHIVEEFRSKDTRIRAFRNEARLGLAASLNRGLAVARGDLVARMDADDVSLPERFARQLTAFGADEGLVLLGSEVEFLSAEGLWLGKKGQKPTHREIRAQLLRGDGSAIVHPTAMFRRHVALAVGGYDEQFVTAQDLDLYLRLSEQGLAANIEIPLLGWRQHAGSVNHSQSRTWPAMKALAVSRVIERIGVNAYVQQLFMDEPEFGFPSNDLEMGRFALRKGRISEAMRLFFRSLVRGPERLPAAVGLSKAVLRTIRPWR